MLKISTSNSKMGNIQSISFPPGETCISNAPCLKSCYARKITCRFSTVKEAWQENLALYKHDPDDFFKSLKIWLIENHCRRFRWHVGGDIPDEYYLNHMNLTATLFPEIQFLCFTKRHDWILNFRERIPDNLVIVLSTWPGMEIPPPVFPRSWLISSAKRITQPGLKDYLGKLPKEYFKCTGGCETCGYCWELAKIGTVDVAFHIH